MNKQNKTKREKQNKTENRLVVNREEHGLGLGKIGKGCQDVQTSSYKVNNA